MPYEYALTTTSKLSCALWSAVATRLLHVLLPKWLRSVAGSKADAAANELVSGLHAAGVVVAASISLWPDACWGTPLDCCTATIEVAQAVSIGYMMADSYTMWLLDYDQLPVMLIHHFIAMSTMVYTAFLEVKGSWFTSVMFLTESCSLFNCAIWFMEHGKKRAQDGGSHGEGHMLVAVRYARLLMWLIFRTWIFVPYFSTAARVHAGMPTNLVVAWVWVVGGFLLVFNLGALATMVLKGFPWRAGSGKGGAEADKAKAQ